MNGSIPSGTITIDYKTGGGSAGNANAGTLTKLERSFTDANGNPVAVAFQPTALDPALFDDAPESVEDFNEGWAQNEACLWELASVAAAEFSPGPNPKLVEDFDSSWCSNESFLFAFAVGPHRSRAGGIRVGLARPRRIPVRIQRREPRGRGFGNVRVELVFDDQPVRRLP